MENGYICEKCGRRYDEVDLWRTRNYDGAPCGALCDCGGDILFACECEICGRTFAGEEYGDNICGKCKDEIREPKRLYDIFDGKREFAEINPLFIIAFGEDGINEILAEAFMKLGKEEVDEFIDELKDEIVELLS